MAWSPDHDDHPATHFANGDVAGFTVVSALIKGSVQQTTMEMKSDGNLSEDQARMVGQLAAI